MIHNKQKQYSAGIIPYTIRDNQIYYLLGRDWRDEGWSDFGGKCEEDDKNKPKSTAIREFYEETMGSVLTYKTLMNEIHNIKEYITSTTLNGSPYYMYFLYIEDIDYIIYFDKIYNFIKFIKGNDSSKYLEKCEIKWVPSSELKRANNSEIKFRNIFKKTLIKCKSQIETVERVILKNALKE